MTERHAEEENHGDGGYRAVRVFEATLSEGHLQTLHAGGELTVTYEADETCPQTEFILTCDGEEGDSFRIREVLE